ncbi:MAG: riboflavin synthase [Desulfobulbus propionicus]|nr:MAG: riboflavin synthase [Desulfobulbus propionicus]
MFTGIVQGLGTVIESRSSGRGRVLSFATAFTLEQPEEGESIACNGACLTAREIAAHSFVADVSPETLDRTCLGALRPGSRVNLERALRLGDRLGGHMVSGHIDCVGEVKERRQLGEFTLFTFSLAAGLSRYVISKGSVAVNGVSLTVNSCHDGEFTLSIIPHTLAMTTLGQLRSGDRVNIEVDIIGKYVEKLLTLREGVTRPTEGVSAAFLAEHGFLK